MIELEPLVRTILVVDDEILIRMAIADHLRDCGYAVIEAGNVDEAIGFLQTEARIGMVFSDVQMPGRDGYELARWVQDERPEVRVILTSGRTQAIEITHGLCSDAQLVRKPYGFDDVARRIGVLLETSI